MHQAAKRILGSILVVVMVLVCAASLSQQVYGQCVDHPAGRTALTFSNETSYDLTFFIDDDEKTTVLAKTSSKEWEVRPGEHQLRARAVIADQTPWVWSVNKVLEGQICTWTIENHSQDGDAVVVPRGAKHNIINLSETDDLKLYTIYSPPHNKAGIVRATKSDAEGNEEVFDGATTKHLPE